MTEVNIEDPSLTVAKVAELFSVRPYTVREWLKNGTLKGYKIPGGHWRVKKSAVQEFAQTMYGDNE